MLVFILFAMNLELKKSVHAKIQHLISAYKNLLTYYIKLLLNAALIVVVFLCRFQWSKMSDEEVLFDDVYDIWETIGK